MNKTQFDQLFETAFEASAHQPPDNAYPDYHPSWQRIQPRLPIENKRKNVISNLTKLAVIASSLLLGAVIFGNSQAARAIEPIYATLKEYPSGVMEFFFGRTEDTDTSKAKTTPPPEYAKGLDIVEVSKDLHMAIVMEAQASKLLSFRAPVFHYLPTGYSSYQVQIYFYGDNERADQAAYQFITDKEKIMTVAMEKMKINTGLGTIKNMEGVSVRKIELSDGPAILTEAKNGSNSLETIAGGIRIAMSGIVPKDELIRMYEEMDK